MDALEKLFHDFVSESRARYIKQDDNHKEVMEKLSGVEVRLENHSARIRNTEGEIEALKPRINTTERFAWGGLAVITACLAVAGFIAGSVRSSTRILIQEEMAAQQELADRVVSKLQNVADIK